MTKISQWSFPRLPAWKTTLIQRLGKKSKNKYINFFFSLKSLKTSSVLNICGLPCGSACKESRILNLCMYL